MDLIWYDLQVLLTWPLRSPRVDIFPVLISAHNVEEKCQLSGIADSSPGYVQFGPYTWANISLLQSDMGAVVCNCDAPTVWMELI